MDFMLTLLLLCHVVAVSPRSYMLVLLGFFFLILSVEIKVVLSDWCKVAHEA